MCLFEVESGRETQHVHLVTATISPARSGWVYVPRRCETEGDVLGSSYEIEIAGERFAAVASLKPMYEPKAERVRM